MAVSKLWSVTTRLGQVIDYATNPKKTAVRIIYTKAQYQALRDVIDYAKDEEKTEHEIELLPTMSLQSDQIMVERGQTEITVSSMAVQKNPLGNWSFMPTQRVFQSSSQHNLPIFDPVKRVRTIRRTIWFAGKAGEILE